MLSPGLNICREEASLIGAMLANYGELEFCLTHCLAAIVGDVNAAFQDMYGERGEQRRIDLMYRQRPHFLKVGIEAEFLSTMGQMRHCKLLRDQYAHAWFSWTGGSIGWGPGPHPIQRTLKLVSLEEAVKDPAGLNAQPVSLPLPLLQEQAAYFSNTQDWIMWLQAQIETAAGKAQTPKPERPELRVKPDRWH
jgi:hypothetical protein